MLCTVGVKGSRRGFPWLSKSKHSVAAGGSWCTFPPDTKQMTPHSAECLRSSSGSWARLCGSPAPPESPPPPGFARRSRCCCCCLATLYQFPHEEPPRRSTANGEYQGINPDGKLFAVGILATTCRESSGLVSDLRRCRGNAVRTGSRSPWTVSPSVMAEVQ